MSILLSFNKAINNLFTGVQTFHAKNGSSSIQCLNDYLWNTQRTAASFYMIDGAGTPLKTGNNSAINAQIDLGPWSGPVFVSSVSSAIIGNVTVQAGNLKTWPDVASFRATCTDLSNTIGQYSGFRVESVVGPIVGSVIGLSVADQTAGASNYAIKTGLGKVVFGDTLRLPVYAVGALPTGVQGDKALVNNALAPAFLAAPVAGGAVVCPVFHDGTSWKVG